MIQFTLWTPLKLHAPASLACAAFSLLSCCLPGRLLSPSLLVSACLLLPAPSFCWALSARLVVLCLGWCLWLLLLCVFGLSSWRGLFCGLFGLFGFVVLFVPGWFLCFVFCFLWLLLTSYWTGTLVYFDFPCTTKAFIIIGLVCLSADWTGSLVLLTSPVHLVFTLVVLCDYPLSTEVTKDGCRLLTLIIHTPATLTSPLLLCPLGVGSSLNSFVLLFRLGCSFAWSLWHLLLFL